MVGSGMICQSIPYREGFGAKQIAWLVHSAVVGSVIAPLTLLGGPLMIRAACYTAGVVGGNDRTFSSLLNFLCCWSGCHYYRKYKLKAKKAKVLPKPHGPIGVALISVSIALSRSCKSTDMGPVCCMVCLFSSQLAQGRYVKVEFSWSQHLHHHATYSRSRVWK